MYRSIWRDGETALADDLAHERSLTLCHGPGQRRPLGGDAACRSLSDGERRGVRGGAVYDWLHLAAARKAGAERVITLNLRDFQALARPGDPRIKAP